MSTKIYALLQVHIDPRSGEARTTHYDEYESVAAAKREAKKTKMKRWMITATEVVAQSSETEEGEVA